MKRKHLTWILVFLLISTLFITFVYISNVSAATYFSDNFENFATGWTTGAGGGGTLAKSSAQAHGGTYSGLVNTTGTSSYAYAYATMTAITTNFHQQICIYPMAGIVYNATRVCHSYDSVSAKTAFYVGVKTVTGVTQLGCYDGTFTPICAINLDTWNTIDVYYYRSEGYIHIYLNGAKEGSDWTAAVTANTSTNRVYIGDGNGNAGYPENGVVYYDDVLIDDTIESGLSASSESNSNNENGVSCAFSCYWQATGSVTCSGYIFSYGKSGAMQNDTWAQFTSTDDVWANVSKTLAFSASDLGQLIYYTWYANDSANAWYQADLNNFTLQATVTFYHNVGGTIDRNSTIITNQTSTTYTSPTVLRMCGISNSTYAYLSFNWTNSVNSNTSNPYIFDVTNQTSLWCYFSLGGGGPAETDFTKALALTLVACIISSTITGMIAARKRRSRQDKFYM